MGIVKRQLPWIIIFIFALAAIIFIIFYGKSNRVFWVDDDTDAWAQASEVFFGGSTVLPEEGSAAKGSAPIVSYTLPLAPPDPPSSITPLLPEKMRGVWIATVVNIDFPKAIGEAEKQKEELTAILDTVCNSSLNTVFFQVRPSGDALYHSQIFPWSQFLTGSASLDPGYDPLAFIIEEAHNRNLALHAWVNPYRLTMGSKDEPQNSHDFLPKDSPLKERADLTFAAGDGRLYLNPGEPQAQALVLAGIREILENYEVDGIHLDDYFYPSNPNYDDSATYAKYGQPAQLALGDWRRKNTQSLIIEIQALVRQVRPDAAFGVSPSGIWQNSKNSPLGSDSNGFESYSQIYADTRQWVKEGLLDYIVPQLYWPIGKEGSDYAKLARWWADVCRDTGVRLYIGHGAYRLGSSDEAAWSTAAEIERQISLNEELGISGSVFYGYRQIKENTLGVRDLLRELYGE
ncbi:MAG: family 10 glycosylhydrolase [Clostridiales bacterium]|nr:family 10 glycosylhydrolase [Clostridiales bacterium]